MIYNIHREGAGMIQMFQTCFASCRSLFDHQRETCNNKLWRQRVLVLKLTSTLWGKCGEIVLKHFQEGNHLGIVKPLHKINNNVIVFISVPARHMMQGSRPPKTSQMRWSVSFDSTLLCIALSTLSPANQCSHVSEWTTPWLRLWWTEFWQRMDSMRLCSWEQVRHKPFLSWNSIF